MYWLLFEWTVLLLLGLFCLVAWLVVVTGTCGCLTHCSIDFRTGPSFKSWAPNPGLTAFLLLLLNKEHARRRGEGKDCQK